TSGLYYVQSGKLTNNKGRSHYQALEIVSFAPLEIELGQEEDLIDNDNEDEDSGFKVEVVSLTSKQTPARLFDIPELGDPKLFQGWADVQGTGDANDYCRVVGKDKQKFLSCKLSGTTGEGHYYVSKLGADLGHAGTWFMQDMDGDGRDDYCRCVGTVSKSKVTCMKAGARGFFGSAKQGGSEHTFTVPLSEHCANKLTSHAFGRFKNL
ncbi:secreted frizzled-related protein precusor, partial [Elysia marginata]